LLLWKNIPLLILSLLFPLTLYAQSCVVYLYWDSPDLDLVEEEVRNSLLIAEAESEKAGVVFIPSKSLKEVEALSRECDNLYLFLAGHSEEDRIGPYSPFELKEALERIRERGTRIPLLVFDTCYWGEVYKERFFAFPETVVVGSYAEELQFGLRGIYLNLSKIVGSSPESILKEVLLSFHRFYYPLYRMQGRSYDRAGFKCQTVRVYYRGVVLSQSVCYDSLFSYNQSKERKRRLK